MTIEGYTPNTLLEGPPAGTPWESKGRHGRVKGGKGKYLLNSLEKSGGLTVNDCCRITAESKKLSGLVVTISEFNISFTL